jgi:hypothetical protein
VLEVHLLLERVAEEAANGVDVISNTLRRAAEALGGSIRTFTVGADAFGRRCRRWGHGAAVGLGACGEGEGDEEPEDRVRPGAVAFVIVVAAMWSGRDRGLPATECAGTWPRWLARASS